MAMGGSSNTVLHMLAIAKEADVDFNLQKINEIADKVAHIGKISPTFTIVIMKKINYAGGVNAVMKEVRRRGGLLQLDAQMINGEILGERIKYDRKSELWGKGEKEPVKRVTILPYASVIMSPKVQP